MAVNHRIGRLVFALVVGVAVAFLSYRWITDPAPRLERQLQENAVQAARAHLQEIVGPDIEIVDPLAADRKVGKAYVYRAGSGWQVSGFYRRNSRDDWHPFLMSLAADKTLLHMRIQDPSLQAHDNPSVEVTP